MEDFFEIAVPVLTLFVALPWLVLHYVTKWKQAPGIAPEDENLLDEMYTLARRLEERVQTVERIVAADHPEYRASIPAPRTDYPLDRQSDRQIDRRN